LGLFPRVSACGNRDWFFCRVLFYRACFFPPVFLPSQARVFTFLTNLPGSLLTFFSSPFVLPQVWFFSHRYLDLQERLNPTQKAYTEGLREIGLRGHWGGFSVPLFFFLSGFFFIFFQFFFFLARSSVLFSPVSLVGPGCRFPIAGSFFSKGTFF